MYVSLYFISLYSGAFVPSMQADVKDCIVLSIFVGASGCFLLSKMLQQYCSVVLFTHMFDIESKRDMFAGVHFVAGIYITVFSLFCLLTGIPVLHVFPYEFW